MKLASQDDLAVSEVGQGPHTGSTCWSRRDDSAGDRFLRWRHPQLTKFDRPVVAPTFFQTIPQPGSAGGAEFGLLLHRTSPIFSAFYSVNRTGADHRLSFQGERLSGVGKSVPSVTYELPPPPLVIPQQSPKSGDQLRTLLREHKQMNSLNGVQVSHLDVNASGPTPSPLVERNASRKDRKDLDLSGLHLTPSRQNAKGFVIIGKDAAVAQQQGKTVCIGFSGPLTLSHLPGTTIDKGLKKKHSRVQEWQTAGGSPVGRAGSSAFDQHVMPAFRSVDSVEGEGETGGGNGGFHSSWQNCGPLRAGSRGTDARPSGKPRHRRTHSQPLTLRDMTLAVPSPLPVPLPSPTKVTL